MKFIKACCVSIITFLFLSSWFISFFHIGDKYKSKPLDEIQKLSFGSIGSIRRFTNSIFPLFSTIGLIFSFVKKLKYMVPFLIIGLFSLLCSFGPFSDYAPYTFLVEYWPYINAFRAPYRILVFTLIFISISNAIFMGLLVKKSKYMSYFIFLIVLVFLYFSRPSFFESYLSQEDVTTFYKGISLIPGNFSVIEYPNDQDNWYLFNIITHGKSLVDGLPGFMQPHEKFLNICGREILNISDGNCRKLVEEYRIRFVIYHSKKYKNWDDIYKNLINMQDLNLVEEYRGDYLFSFTEI